MKSLLLILLMETVHAGETNALRRLDLDPKPMSDSTIHEIERSGARIIKTPHIVPDRFSWSERGIMFRRYILDVDMSPISEGFLEHGTIEEFTLGVAFKLNERWTFWIKHTQAWPDRYDPLVRPGEIRWEARPMLLLDFTIGKRLTAH